MKKAFQFTAQIVLSIIIAGIISLGVYALTKNEAMAASTVAFGWILVALFMGAFDVKEKQSKYNSIKHRMGSRNYGQAAVFIGTACLYMGTPQQCEDVCDDLWHRGVQAEYHELTGEETQFDII